MSHPFLPKRKSGTENRFPDPPAPSVWDERPKNHLESLGGAIEVSSTEHRIHSIPDPWARAILFDRALLDPDHLLHETIQGEWRGLLAILALRERRNFTGLSAREVVLDPARATPGTFNSVVAQLRPSNDNLISAETRWEQFYTLRWHRQPFAQNRPQAFAMTSPTTLVCAGADYQNVLSTSEVPWFIGGVLSDPKNYLSARERQAMSEWLLLISNHIVSLGHKSPRSNWMVRSLRAFASDLNPELSRLPSKADREAATSLESKILGESSLDMHYGLYRLLDRACKGEATALSDVEIVSKPGAPRYVLVDPTISEQWNENPREITVYRDINLSTAGRLTSSGKTFDVLDKDNGISWCAPEFFFADRLIYESDPSAAFPGCMPVKTSGSAQRRNIVLPLNPEVLQLLTPADIAERFTIEWLSNGRANCTLKLTLKSGDGKQRLCRIQKAFSEQEMTRVENLPMVCMWPDFRLANVNWKANYTFQLWPGDKEELSVKPWSEGGREPAAYRKYSLDKQRFQIYRTDAYPEALICETPYFNATQQRERMAKGILLLQTPEIAAPAPSSVILGVDFGSTGSNVYMRIDQGDPQPALFRSRIRQVTDFDVNKFAGNCRDLFVPARDWPAESILSLFHDFGDPPEGDNYRLTLRDGHVLYSDDPRKLISGDRKRVRSNLKWGGERERIAARDFLLQVCLQAAAEVAVHGAGEVDIRFSYPTAFSRRDLGLFMGHWNYVAKMVSEWTGVNLRHNPNKVDNREAVTATRFFTDYTGHGDRLDITGGAITLDIGGGTTDFAVWNKRALLSHSSVILAGRDILLAPIRRKPQILHELDPQVALDGLQSGQRDAAFNAQLDAIISKHGKGMIESLPVRQARPTVQGLLSIMELGLAGLTFYAGLLVRRLAEAQKFQQGRRISIFVGGNGSKMFSWCSLGADLNDSEIHSIAAEAFRAGSNMKDLRVELQLSARPKSEVAHGLVSDPLPLEKEDEHYDHALAGENFRVGDHQVDWKESPDSADIQAKRVVADRSFPLFSRFLGAIQRPINEDTLDRIGGYVDTRFAQQAQEIEDAKRKDPSTKAGDVIRNEPVFIMALKRYLELEIDAWEKRF